MQLTNILSRNIFNERIYLNILLFPEQIETSVKDLDELANQNEIRYGLVKGGATESLFKVLNDIELFQNVEAEVAHAKI